MLTDSDGLGGWDETRRAAPLSSSHAEEHGEGEAPMSRVEGRGG